MNNNCLKPIIGGLITAILAWTILTISDAFDEVVLNTGSSVGSIVFLGFPIFLFIKYIIHYIKYRPKIQNLLIWFGCYSITFLLLGGIIGSQVSNNTYIVYQADRSNSWIHLIGVEYGLFLYTAWIGFSILCIIFHIVYFIVKKLKTSKLNSDENI